MKTLWSASDRRRSLADRRFLGAVSIVTAQSLATLYLIVDGFEDAYNQLRSGLTVEVVIECLVAIGLAAGVGLGVRYVGQLLAEIDRQDSALQVARGALADIVAIRFAGWRFSRAEAEVAMLALKGFQVAEIAALRGSASGTIRSQLSQIYAKAGVSSQAMLVALFFDELLEPTDGKAIVTKAG